ncbi:hypothetical protein KP509_09G069400 [Ceratopteris richardii]|nr:hypothetical protein KP509_09G069400 [Ceratopteris richardii]
MNMVSNTSTAEYKPIFVPIKDSKSVYGTGSTFDEGVQTIRLVSYNILAQVYVKSACFPHAPSHCLRWKVRSRAILERLLSFKADILCLQELDEYETFYKTQMDDHGYSSIYVKRPGKKKDGCGIFYRRDRLSLIENKIIQYNDLVPQTDGSGLLIDAARISNEGLATSDGARISEEGLATSDRGGHSISGLLMDEERITDEESATSDRGRGDPNDPRVRLKRDCVGIMAAFRVSRDVDSTFIVTNTHIYWDPDWVDVKLAQVKYLVTCISGFKRLLEAKLHTEIPFIICGDFNSTPGDQVYSYLISAEGSTMDNPGVSLSMEQKSEKCMPLYSLYASFKDEPDFTNFTPEFTGTIDYIFFSSFDIIKPSSLLVVPSAESEDLKGGLPNQSHPSDHLPIGADCVIAFRA